MLVMPGVHCRCSVSDLVKKLTALSVFLSRYRSTSGSLAGKIGRTEVPSVYVTYQTLTTVFHQDIKNREKS